MGRLAGLAVWGWLGVVCTGCAATPIRHNTPGVPVAQFPTQGELEMIRLEPGPPQIALTTHEVDRWQLDAPVPAPGAPYSIETGWDRLVAERLSEGRAGDFSAPSIQMDAALRCAALETARFYVSTGGYPGEALRNHLGLRCGSGLGSTRISTLSFDAPKGVSDRELEARYAADVRELLRPLARSKVELEVGSAYARGNGRATFVAVSGQPGGRLFDLTPTVTGVGVTLRGELRGEVTQLLGLANRGRLGVRLCEPNPAVELPKFQFFCPLDEGDVTRVDIVVRRPQRVIFEPVVSRLLRRNDGAGSSYEPLLFGPDAPAAGAKAFGAALEAALAAARKAAGVAALTWEVDQSAAAERYIPLLFQASDQRQPEVVDRVANGLLAGWNVKGRIRDGGFFLGQVPTERPSRWLASALESPIGRYLLLDPSASRVAVGATEPMLGVSGAIVLTYQLFEPADRELARSRIATDLNRARSALGKARVRLRPPSPALKTAIDRVNRDGISAIAALDDAVADAHRESGDPISGFCIETVSLDQPRWPGELVRREGIDIELGLTHYQPKGAAWGQYAVLFLIRPSSDLPN